MSMKKTYRPSRVLAGRLSSRVRLTARSANSCRMASSPPGRSRWGAHTIEVLKRPGPCAIAGSAEGQLIEGLVDRALDRVLDRHQRLRHLAAGDRLDAVDDAREGHGLDGRSRPHQRQEGLLRERPGRTEVADPHPADAASA